MRLPFEAFLALRYLRPRRTFVSVITVISIVGVLLGVAVLIIVIAVMSGFDKDWRDRILGFNAHLKVYSAERGPLTDYEVLMKQIAADSNDVVGVAPFVVGVVAAESEPADGGSTNISAPLLMGIDPASEGSVSVLPQSITNGKFDLSDKGILIGIEYAANMGLTVGDRIALYLPGTLRELIRTARESNAVVPIPEEFTVRGIFDVGFPDYNANIIVTSVDDAAELFKLPSGAVNGIQVKLRDPFQADAVVAKLKRNLQRPLTYVTWQEDAPKIFDALAVEKNMMFFLLFFIMIVAGFGIVNCQITFVVQKTREIGILKSLGATNGQILWIFLSQSIVVGVLGVGLGLGLAILALDYRNEFLHFMRHVTHTELLPSSVYYVYELPAVIQSGDVSVICGTAFFTCILAGLFPAWKASRLQPVEALRHE